MARTEVVIPSYGMTDADTYVQEWLVVPGQRVDAGTGLVLVETAKAEGELEAPVSGIVGDILVPADSEVAPGTVLTWIESEEA